MTDETTQPTETTETPAPPALQLQDIMAAAQCIQLASSRGAYRAEEFTQVGGLYERLVAFLQASGALQPAPQATEPTQDNAPAA
jgi:hypothetical protein